MKLFISLEELKELFSNNQSVIDVLELVEDHQRETEVKDYIVYEMNCSDTWADMWE